MEEIYVILLSERSQFEKVAHCMHVHLFTVCVHLYDILVENSSRDGNTCRGPAPVDPGNSKRERRRRGSGYNSLIKL